MRKHIKGTFKIGNTKIGMADYADFADSVEALHPAQQKFLSSTAPVSFTPIRGVRWLGDLVEHHEMGTWVGHPVPLWVRRSAMRQVAERRRTK